MTSSPTEVLFVAPATGLHSVAEPQLANVNAQLLVADGLPDNGERSYLGAPTVLLRLGSICVFDQTRDGINPEQASLQESVATIGLLNSLDVVRLSRLALAEYNTFVGELWGKERCLADMPESTHQAGMYDTLVAGHSRLAAIWALERLEAARVTSLGGHYDPALAKVPAKLHPANRPIDLLAIQISENIHRAPSPERTAIALVESYYLGLREGIWSSTRDFQAQNANRFSRRQLANAIAFARLPEAARTLVFARSIPYSVGVLLGEHSATVNTYMRYRYFSGLERQQLHEDERVELDALVESQIMLEATRLLKTKLNITAARKRYEGERQRMAIEMSGNSAQLSLDVLFDQAAAKERRQHVRQNKDLIKRALDEMLTDKSEQFVDVQRRIREYADSNDETLNVFADGMDRIAAAARAKT